MMFLKTFFSDSQRLQKFFFYSRENIRWETISICNLLGNVDTNIFIWSMCKPLWRQLIGFFGVNRGYRWYVVHVNCVNSILYSHLTGSDECVRQEDIYLQGLITDAKQFIGWMCSLSELSLWTCLFDRVRPLW